MARVVEKAVTKKKGPEVQVQTAVLLKSVVLESLSQSPAVAAARAADRIRICLRASATDTVSWTMCPDPRLAARSC
jgi:hypothetical protein